MIPFEETDLFGSSDDQASVSDWSIVAPTPKALPLPPVLQSNPKPRIRAPFQVSASGSSSMDRAEVCSRRNPVEYSPGLALPQSRETSIESLRYPDLKVGSSQSSGLPAPAFSQPLPFSLQSRDLDAATDLGHPVHEVIQMQGLSTASMAFNLTSKGCPPNPQQRFSNQASNLTRVRISSSSPIVWNLWENFSDQMHPFSSVLQQLRSSEFCTEHSERFLNQFAAATLVRYMSCLLQFLQLCVIMHVNVDDLSEALLADLLISGALARRADGSGPKCSVTIKSLRWAHKQLGVHAFGCAFGALVASFEKQKFETDRKESLPYPAFVLMKWERRILQSNTPLKEVIILGGFLLLCWSGLRFSDLQRCRLSTWQLDSTSLRGLTWRAKTCNSSTPFGVVTSGLLSKGSWTWIHKFLSTLDELYAAESPDDIDFALPSFGNQDTPQVPFDAMTYAEALFYIRYYMTLPWSQQSVPASLNTKSYSVHGLKATILSWAAQANLPETDRRIHGKHRPAQASVQLYSRDDILGSLRVQTALIQQIANGWRPVTPLGRGGQVPMTEPSFVLEQFKKDRDCPDWIFFRFNQASSLQFLADVVENADDVGDQLSASSSSDSSSSSSSDSDVESQPAPMKKPRASSQLELGPAEEALVGLHRKTWHIMMPASLERPDLPVWQGQALKTACGRYLSPMTICPGLDMQIAFPQALCSHVGCRKGFISIGLEH